MKLALIGRDISHSQSPQLYKNILGPEIEYDLLDFATPNDLPPLNEIVKKYDAVNITSPYKEHYFKNVKIEDEEVKELGAINTIVFTKSGPVATNTDFVAVKKILKKFTNTFENPKFILLGSGVMARLTLLAAKSENLLIEQMSRSLGNDMENLDLSFHGPFQTVIVNSCSRKYSFKGKINKEHIFWDYNYNFKPHQSRLPGLVKAYQDGQEMLLIQAKEAITFWNHNKT